MYNFKIYKLKVGDTYYLACGSRIKKGILVQSTKRGFNFADCETDELLFKRHIYPMETQRDGVKVLTFQLPMTLIVDQQKYGKQRKVDVEIRDELIVNTTTKERREVLFDWVRRGRIDFKQFNDLIYYIA